MDRHQLSSALLKLNRAFAHLTALKDAIERRREERPHNLTRQDEPQGDDWWLSTYTVEVTSPFPPEWSLLIGEFLHNIHAALDHVSWQLAAKRSFPADPERITFPIYKKRRGFWKPDKDGRPWRTGSGGWKLRHMPGDARLPLLEVQPYKRGDRSPDHPLWLLHELSNEDKHKSIHLMSSAVAKKRLKNTQLENIELGPFDIRSEPFDTKAEIGWLHWRKLASKASIYTEPGFAIGEAFPESGPAPGRPLFPTLNEIYNYVVDEVFVARFGPYFGLSL